MEQDLTVLLFFTCSAIALVALGILIHHFKAYWLMAGYSAMPAEEKDSIDWHRFTLFFRNVLFCFSALLPVSYFIMWEYPYLCALYIAILAFGAIFLIFWGKKKYTLKDADTE